MKKSLILITLSTMLFAACNTTAEPVKTAQDPNETESTTTMEKSVATFEETGDEANESPEQIAKEKAENAETKENSTTTGMSETASPQYISYSADTYKNLLGKKPFALFFHATWCSTCIKMNKNITGELSTFPNGAIILKADYDTETELKETYGITSQSTIVIVDKNGKALKTLVAPDNEELIEEISATL